MSEEKKIKNDKEIKAERFSELNKTALKGKIVCAGSSLMEMFPIEKFLKESGSETVIYNRGIGGYMIHELRENLDTCVLELKPSRLFINIGTNDLSWSSISAAQVVESYEEVLGEIYKVLPETEIYVMAYFPINYEAASDEMKPCLLIRTNDKINEANAGLKKMSERLGAKYIDINDSLKDETSNLKAEYTIEGMHIKECGYRAIYDEFMKYATEPAWKSGLGRTEN